MTLKDHGNPCWFELTTPDLGAARGFYADVLGWEVKDAGMPGFTYLLAGTGKGPVAGLMEPMAEGMPAFWMLYLAVTDVDGTAAAIAAEGGKIHREPADIPGTGRFAVVVDPQGAVFGLLQPLPMDTPPASGAFDPATRGHGNWIELQTPDQSAAMAFYGRHFGWRVSRSMPMGEMGSYDLIERHGTEIGGMMGMLGAPMPAWLPYFGVDDIAGTMAKIKSGGGKILNGPNEVPGPALIVQAADPAGASFAVVGPKPD